MIPIIGTMEMTTIKNPISRGELFLLGAKEDEKVMKNKSTICVDRLAAGTILYSPQEQCDQMPYSPEEQCDKERILPSNNSFHSLPPTTEINHRMGTRRNNNSQGRNTMQDKQPLNVETFVLPKLSPRLSRREKEEDFLAIKGSKLPMKPKKRLKRIQNAIHDVSPGFWLSTISEERYEVGENKSTKKRARGSKAMKGVGSDLA